MGITDIIKKSVLNEFTGKISVVDVSLSLITAFILGLFIIYVYKKTFNGVVYSKSFALCLMLLGMITALIIRTINSNLSLSLGMVGALSIVRFRTAVKEPVDTAFMFWSITIGIMAGAGLYLVALVATVALGLLYFITYSIGFKKETKYLFIIKYQVDIDKQVIEKIKRLPKHKLKSKSITKDTVEITFEIEIKEEKTDILDKFKDIDGIISTSIISYQNDFGA